MKYLKQFSENFSKQNKRVIKHTGYFSSLIYLLEHLGSASSENAEIENNNKEDSIGEHTTLSAEIFLDRISAFLVVIKEAISPVLEFTNTAEGYVMQLTQANAEGRVTPVETPSRKQLFLGATFETCPNKSKLIAIMGNSMNPGELLKEHEYQSGQKLIRAIKANSRSQIESCMAIVKQELMSTTRSMAHDKDYEHVLTKTRQYLTRGYNIGDGVIFTKTPLEIAEMHNSDEAIACINELLDQLQRREDATKVNAASTRSSDKSSSGGAIDKARVAEAKERLKAFQQERKKT